MIYKTDDLLLLQIPKKEKIWEKYDKNNDYYWTLFVFRRIFSVFVISHKYQTNHRKNT